MRNWLKPLVLPLILLPCLAQAASLARVDGFYTGVADVESRSASARQLAISESLIRVLVRMTGDVSVSLRLESSEIIAQAPAYVRSYRYVMAEPEPGRNERALRLRVDFDPVALKQAVKQAGLPVWDDLRPVTVVWMLAPGDTGPREIQTRERIEQELPMLAEAAQRRGLPLRFPLADAEDLSALNTYDIIAQDYVRIEGASQRYEARHLLLLRLQPQVDSWDVYWSFLREQQQPLIWRSSGEDVNQALALGFDAYADQLAQLYAVEVAAGWVQTLRLRVVGLQQLEAYARTLNYLEGLNLVESAMPVELADGDVVFLLRFEGTQADLQRQIELGDLLEPAPAPPPQFSFAPSASAPGPAAPTGVTSGIQGQGGQQVRSASPGTTVSEGPTAAATPAGVEGSDAQSGPQSGPQGELMDAWAGGAQEAQQAAESGLSFFALSPQPELRYRLRP